MPQLLRIGLLVESSLNYGRSVIHGALAYARGHADWTIVVSAKHDIVPQSFPDWDLDGLIVRTLQAEDARYLVDLKIPIVALPGRAVIPDHLRYVYGPSSDGTAVAKLALEHFQERGHRRFGLCGYNDVKPSWMREFAKIVRDGGFELHEYQPLMEEGGNDESGAADADDLDRWMRGLPHPIAIFCFNDSRARHVTDACRRVGVDVPTEAAVLGVGNDTLLCESCSPPLSSVETDAQRIGYEAAAMLDAMLRGQMPSPAPMISPRRVVGRASTDLLAIDDPDVADAVAFIRDHISEPISVESLLDIVPVSRSTLEHRFKALLGRTPASEIERVRIAKAKELLEFTDVRIDRIAARCGYSSGPRFTEAFRRHTGLTPSAHRKNRKSISGY